MAHDISLIHSTDDDQVMYNGIILGDNKSILVASGDTLTFTAVGADWKLNLLIVDGDYDHSDILIEENNKISINVDSVPKDFTIFEAVCEVCKNIPLEAPKRIIISSVRPINQNPIQDVIKNKLKRIEALLADMINK